MSSVKLSLACTVAFMVIACHALTGQNYSLSPGDSIVAQAQLDELTVYNILQNNISSDTLWLSYEKLNANIPAGWEAISCDNVNCYSYLKDDGVMLPVVVGDYGLMSMHITPHINNGTAVIQYRVWETNNPSSQDTLTWIISYDITGIEDLQTTPAFFLAGNQLIIQGGGIDPQILKVMNVEGKILLNRNLAPGATIIDLSTFIPGIYLVEFSAGDKRQVQKIFLQ